MRSARHVFLTCFVMLLIISASGFFFWYKPKFSNHKQEGNFVFKKVNYKDNEATMTRLKQKAFSLRTYLVEHDYNSTCCFLLDMKLPSGEKRFFVYNLPKDSIEIAGLVTYGSGSDKGGQTLYFSNTPNSNCTSLGKYRIGNSYIGKFGLAYKLYGLDDTNSKAFRRFVVLHSHPCVPNDEVSPSSICESWGCPTVSPEFLTQLKSYIDRSEEPILLWIYY